MRILALAPITAAMVVLLPELAAAVTIDAVPPSLPAPGILGLVVLGVVGAIAFARSRK